TDVRDLGTGAGVRAAVQGDLQRDVEVADPLLQLVDQLDGALLRHHVGELAELQARAANDVPTERGRVRGQSKLLQVRGDRVSLIRGDVQEQDLLIRGRAQTGQAVGFGQVRELLQLGAVRVPHRGLHAHVDVSVLLLMDANVVAVAG